MLGLNDPSLPHEPPECALPRRLVAETVARDGISNRHACPPYAYFHELAGHVMAELDRARPADRQTRLAEAMRAEYANRFIQWRAAVAPCRAGTVLSLSRAIAALRRRFRLGLRLRRA
jgi:hypothetical protein